MHKITNRTVELFKSGHGMWSECLAESLRQHTVNSADSKKTSESAKALVGRGGFTYPEAIESAIQKHIEAFAPPTDASKQTVPSVKKVEVKPTMEAKKPDVEIVERTLAKVKAEGIPFNEAMNKVLKENPDLVQAYFDAFWG